jgi:TRAP-type transport system small permease protein
MNLLDRILRFLLCVLVGSIFLDIILQISARKVFNVSIPWTEELARYLMVWCGFIGLGVAYRAGELHTIEVLTQRLGIAQTIIFRIISNILILIFLVVVIVYGVKLCHLNLDNISPNLNVSMAYMYMSVPLGCFLTLLISLEKIFLSVNELKAGEVL